MEILMTSVSEDGILNRLYYLLGLMSIAWKILRYS